jgi:hypothetical protein
MAQPVTSYTEFWPYYLCQHRRPATRALHYLGTVSGLGCLALAAILAQWGWLAATPVAGYLPAWIGHIAVERNRPATFRHPLWSFVGDFHMLGLAATGRLGRELAKHGIT